MGEFLKKVSEGFAKAGEIVEKGVCDLADGLEEKISDERAKREEELREAAKEEQKEKDIVTAVIICLELKANDDTIYEMLDKHFKVGMRKQATSYIVEAKAKRKEVDIKQYYDANIGKTPTEFFIYAREHNLHKRLCSDSRLLGLTPSKILKELEAE